MSSQIQNIPSVWTVISHWLSMNLYLGFMPRRLGKWQTVSISLGFLAVLFVYHGFVAGLDGVAFNLGMCVQAF